MWKKVLKPITIIPTIRGDIFIWIVLIFIFGQFGIIASVFSKFENIKIEFIRNIEAGNFYTFSIALLASAILPFAKGFVDSNEVKFKQYKMFSILAAFLLILIMSFKFTALSGQEITALERYFQIFLYTVSLFVSLYFLCVDNLEKDYSNFKDLDDTATKELKEKSSNKSGTDERGVKIT
ncbi:hypothetical protein ACQKDB_17105 [Planococcus kocurii]|uniref:hypothetical protein n=1 Tax=Planococcus kocurii TaxID=1374 RepID=UPI003D02B734